MNIIDKAKHHFLTKEFFLFLVIGCINTFNGTFIAWLCSYLTPYNNLNFNIGYIMGNIIAYWMNSVIIFHEKLSLGRYVKFFISYVPNYIIQNIIVLIFYNWLDFPPVVSYLLAAILGIPVTFLMVKIFAFGRKKAKRNCKNETQFLFIVLFRNNTLLPRRRRCPASSPQREYT